MYEWRLTADSRTQVAKVLLAVLPFEVIGSVDALWLQRRIDRDDWITPDDIILCELAQAAGIRLRPATHDDPDGWEDQT
jgi:hypothetical protein